MPLITDISPLDDPQCESDLVTQKAYYNKVLALRSQHLVRLIKGPVIVVSHVTLVRPSVRVR